MIQRAERYSPNSVEKDRAILEAVAEKLRLKGCEVTMFSEDSCTQVPVAQYDMIFSMARLPETLAWLKTVEATVVNAPEGVENCQRSKLQATMERIGTPAAPREGSDGYWLKRGDGAAQTKSDVIYCADVEALERGIREMAQRGIKDYTVSAHVGGDLVKFYGVGSDFFRYYYPTDDGQTKFGDEARNGEAHHYPFGAGAMQREAARLAESVGVRVYGGDCIVRSDGSFCLIDFNDWPSFSRCREEAAQAIVELID